MGENGDGAREFNGIGLTDYFKAIESGELKIGDLVSVNRAPKGDGDQHKGAINYRVCADGYLEKNGGVDEAKDIIGETDVWQYVQEQIG